MKVELIYDQDCPNISDARIQLLRSFQSAQIPPKWTEWERNSPDSPAYVQGYGSPTILINGKDVDGVNPVQGVSSCRVYQNASGALKGVPSAGTITSLLKSQSVRRSGWTGIFATLPGVGAAILPVGMCPACWPAYAGLLGSIGLGVLLETAYLLPLTVVFLSLALFALWYRARARRGYLPLVVGSTGSVMIIVFKFLVVFGPLFYAGLGLLIAASIWNSWPIQPKSGCPSCASKVATSPKSKHVNEQFQNKNENKT